MTSPRHMETDCPNQQIIGYKSTQRIKLQQNETKLLPKLFGRGHQKELEKLPCLEAGSSHVPLYIINANPLCMSHILSFHWCHTAHVYYKKNKGKSVLAWLVKCWLVPCPRGQFWQITQFTRYWLISFLDLKPFPYWWFLKLLFQSCIVPMWQLCQLVRWNNLWHHTIHCL